MDWLAHCFLLTKLSTGNYYFFIKSGFKVNHSQTLWVIKSNSDVVSEETCFF